MRIVVGELIHEGNTFYDERIRFEDFDPLFGAQGLEENTRLRDSATAGIIQTLREENAEIIPILFLNAHAAPALVHEDYLKIKDIFATSVRDAGKVDGICLGVHGSMYVDGEDDPEGGILSELREIVGPSVPIVATLDMHATMKERMVNAVDAFVGYHTAPHVDKVETGRKAANLMLEMVKDRIKVRMEWIRMPMLLAGEQSETAVSPMKDLIALAKDVERRPGMLSASYLLGFPWADTPHNGVNAIVVGEAISATKVRESCEELARAFWEKKAEFDFTTEAHTFDDSLDIALESPEHPVIISDSGDNPTAGASQDLTITLKRMMERKIPNALVVFIADPESCRRCFEAGPGKSITLYLGRESYSSDAKGLKVEAEILCAGKTFKSDTAVIRVEGITVVVGSRRSTAVSSGSAHMVYDPAFIEELNLSPKDFDTIVVKSGYLGPKYAAIAKRRILALTPGDTNEILGELQFDRIPRPMYPLDDNVEWSI